MVGHIPKISIVVPSYNQGLFLRGTLDSIFKQEYPNLEIFIMDSGSTDQSLSIAQAYDCKVRRWESLSDGGRVAAINQGVQHGTGELVAWLKPGERYIDGALWTVAQARLKHPGYGLYVGNGFRHKNGEFKPFCPRHVALCLDMLWEGFDHVLQPSAFISREAWFQSGGLCTDLRFSSDLDLDLFIRVLEYRPAVVINEFLAMSRAGIESETVPEKRKRIEERIALGRKHTGKEMTLGAAFYFLDALLKLDEGNIPELMNVLQPYTGQDNIQNTVFYIFRPLFWHTQDRSDVRLLARQAMKQVQQEMHARWGTDDPFPVHQDFENTVFLQIPENRFPVGKKHLAGHLPKISIIIPSFNQAEFLPRTLESILQQNYPSLEIIVYDGGSIDGSIDVIKQYAPHLAYWSSEPDHGPAHALNKGFARASGDIIGWLNSDDMLAEGALWHVAREFVEHPSTNVVFGNALYVDENDQLFLADHGYQKTAFYYGRLEPVAKVPYYWAYVHSIPQPTVYFRRDVLQKVGNLNPSYQFIFDFEYFWRLRQIAEFQKIEKTLAFYRVHTSSKTSHWHKFLVELYRFSRPLWPPVHTKEFKSVLNQFVSYFFKSYAGGYKRRDYPLKLMLKAAVIAGFINPEKLAERNGKKHGLKTAQSLRPRTPAREQMIDYHVDTSNRKYDIGYCGFFYPYHPGQSGGEIRDFHILRKLCSIAEVDFFALTDPVLKNRIDYLRKYIRTIISPSFLKSCCPELTDEKPLSFKLWARLAAGFKIKKNPAMEQAYHADVSSFFRLNEAYVIRGLNDVLKTRTPDFLFIGPQLNPLVLQRPSIPVETRVILSSYDIEKIRIGRMAKSQIGFAARQTMELEARRAEAFERDTLKHYDGIIAVSELDKQTYIAEYGFEPERILALDNSVDIEYFSFKPRVRTSQPEIVFTASLGYWPNDEAAQRLVKRIMPLVRKDFPDARVWIVGQNPSPELLKPSDGKLNIVTGPVPDVRPYLDMATLTCIPLLTGSGTKYKVLEAASIGVPIGCTSLALEGLSLEPDEHASVGESDDDLARAIVRIISDPQRYADVAIRAAMHVRKHYSWDANLDKLDSWLDLIKKLPRRAL
jgi:glycosyltransferase involved in cell wall biosynthesis